MPKAIVPFHFFNKILVDFYVVQFPLHAVKSSEGILAHQGHISQVNTNDQSLTHSQTNITSRASCDAKNNQNEHIHQDHQIHHNNQDHQILQNHQNN